jgi:carnitine 3-dehydrogenase
VTTQILDHDEKRLHVFHALHRADGDGLLATAEQMLLHVDAATGRAAPAAPAVLERVAAIAAVHASLPRPERAGRAIGMRA